MEAAAQHQEAHAQAATAAAGDGAASGAAATSALLFAAGSQQLAAAAGGGPHLWGYIALLGWLMWLAMQGVLAGCEILYLSMH